MYELLKTLTELPGVLGHEDPVQDFVRERWQPHCQDIKTTRVGNVIARVGGQGPRLLMVAHADEIGVIVRAISPEGMIWVGPKNDRAGRPGRDLHLLGHPCLIQTGNGTVSGVFATVSGHVTPPELKEKAVLGWSDFWVDVGATSAQEALDWGIQIGDGVIWTPETRRLGGYIVGKAMDDRAGLAIMTALLEKLDPARLHYDLTMASSVQEEVGLVGAYSLERDERFDLAITIDVGLSGDIPRIDPNEITTRLGAGPILVHHDHQHYDRNLTRALADVAAECGIPVQHAVFTRYSSDGAALIQGGLPSALVAFATRYTHSPYEMLAESDLWQCVELLHEFLIRPGETA